MKNYTIRKLGFSQFGECRTIKEARRLLAQAQRIGGDGYVIIHNRSQRIVR